MFLEESIMMKAEVFSLSACRARRDLHISQALVPLLANISICQLATALRSSGAVTAEIPFPTWEP